MYDAYNVYNMIYDTLKCLYAFTGFIFISSQLNAQSWIT